MQTPRPGCFPQQMAGDLIDPPLHFPCSHPPQVQAALEADPTALDADKLMWISGPDVRRLLKWSRPLPLEEERARLLREVGGG